jgi:hypothetical protein
MQQGVSTLHQLAAVNKVAASIKTGILGIILYFRTSL